VFYTEDFKKGSAMVNFVPQGKAKSRKETKPGAANVVSVETTTATKKPLGFKGSRKLRTAAYKASLAARLRAGTRLLNTAVNNYVEGEVVSGDNQALSTSLKQAYASIINSLPEEHRLPLLVSMKNSLDEVARSELHVTLPAPTADTGAKRVTTADFIASLERQEREQRERDLASKTLLSGAEIAARLGITPQALSTALKAKRIFVLTAASGDYAYPAFFAEPRYDRRVLEAVCKTLRDLPGGSKWDFFNAPRISLGDRSPLEALAKGQVEAVMAAANAFRDE
jgi:hypothetical protein